MNKNYHHKTVRTVISELNSSINGLDQDEVQKRQSKFGLNKLIERKQTPKIFIFLSQFNSLLIYVLILAALISFLFKEYVDASVIMSAVFLNAIIGFFQENKAHSDLSKLKTYIKHQVFVRRSGKQYLINVESLVLGDIVLLQAGSKVPADLRIIESNELKVDESILTGESIAVNKSKEKTSMGASLGDRSSLLYMGTTVVKGNALAIVIATGMKTEIGKIAAYVNKTKDESTSLEIRLKKLGRMIGIIAIFICLLIFILGIFLGRSALEMFLISVAIAVSSIPEGLPVAITVVLAIGMQRILKEKSLVRRLVAAETLGSTTVICSDKTGTLTLGKMKIFSVIFDKQEINLLANVKKNISERTKEILRIGFLCNDAFFEDRNSIKEGLKEWKISGSPTDQALLSSAIDLGMSLEKEQKKYPRINEITFDSSKKYMCTLHKDSDSRFNDVLFLCKGAPEVILKHCVFVETEDGTKRMSQKYRQDLKDIETKLTSQGLRLLALARKKIRVKDLNSNLEDGNLEDNFESLTFIGFITLKDPLRKTAQQTIKTCIQAGIRPVIITGDHKLTARKIAQEVGLKIKSENILLGEELDKINDDDLRSKVRIVNLYARVSPHHKLRIIKALQENNEVVAMAGDGINDAPAIQMADIGIALGSGTDIAKETAELVLLNNDFSVIIQAIKQGRIIFDNLRKIVVYLLSDSFSGMLLVVSAVIFGLPLPLIPAQILWINIVNDSLPNFALAFEKGDKDIMKRSPLKKDEAVLDKEMKFLIFVIGIFTDLGILTLFIYLFKTGLDINHIRTYMFVALGIDSLVYVYSCKNLKRQIWNYKLFDNHLLVIATFLSFVMLMVGIYVPFFQKILRTVPLGKEGLLIMFGVIVFEVFSIEIGKWFFIHKRFRKK